MARQSQAPAPSDAILLLTRPEAASERFAQLYQARFGPATIVISPLTEISPCPVVPHKGDAIFTSENGVIPFLNGHLPPLGRAFCVGPRTAAAARQAGFRDVITGPGDATGLAGLIAAYPGPFVHYRGQEIAVSIAQLLQKHGTKVQECLVYKQKNCPASTQMRDALCGGRAVIVPLFSQKSAQRLAQALQDMDTSMTADLYIVSISQNTANALGAITAQSHLIAEQPDASGVLNTLARLHRLRNAG
ncbi:hypothetical protein BFP70_14980 [Thioclava sp. SK-1]|uniref:uroporphyrinogen-III synthase n=1 Tax=Thioclava sp. SK-1 TaxID=1889770 RepID=UPI000825AD88|nr:uroporphyrinogen-III synthase [Thioclava sp. SK-1]OCX61611.1 hypothetical protein BFP70_14980 [Thioclava sp. SK-1]